MPAFAGGEDEPVPERRSESSSAHFAPRSVFTKDVPRRTSEIRGVDSGRAFEVFTTAAARTQSVIAIDRVKLVAGGKMFGQRISEPKAAAPILAPTAEIPRSRRGANSTIS